MAWWLAHKLIYFYGHYSSKYTVHLHLNDSLGSQLSLDLEEIIEVPFKKFYKSDE